MRKIRHDTDKTRSGLDKATPSNTRQQTERQTLCTVGSRSMKCWSGLSLRAGMHSRGSFCKDEDTVRDRKKRERERDRDTQQTKANKYGTVSKNDGEFMKR